MSKKRGRVKLLVKVCNCEDPLPQPQLQEGICPICGKVEKVLSGVVCGRCGYTIVDSNLSEYSSLERRCEHTEENRNTSMKIDVKADKKHR